MSDDAQRELREIQTYLRLPSVGLVEKDLQVVRAIATIAAIDAAPFMFVFGGGTALARAHRIIRRMSEDVDFKIVPLPAAPVGRAMLRQKLRELRDKVTNALQAAGFNSEPANVTSRNESRYTVWHLPYATVSGEGLRPTIQIEMTYAPLRQAPVTLPVSSFVAEAYRRRPEVAEIPCVSIAETAAEKLVALTRRIAMEIANPGRERDSTLVRHIYDLHVMRDLIDPAEVATLARAIAEIDGQEFRNQYPAYVADIAGETRKALAALQTDLAYRAYYRNFVTGMVYGEKPEFDVALGSVVALANRMI